MQTEADYRNDVITSAKSVIKAAGLDADDINHSSDLTYEDSVAVEIEAMAARTMEAYHRVHGCIAHSAEAQGVDMDDFISGSGIDALTYIALRAYVADLRAEIEGMDKHEIAGLSGLCVCEDCEYVVDSCDARGLCEDCAGEDPWEDDGEE